MKSLASILVDKEKELFNEALEEDSTAKMACKASLSGILSGATDACIVIGALCAAKGLWLMGKGIKAVLTK